MSAHTVSKTQRGSFRKSTPPQNRQLIVYCNQLKYQVDGFVREFTFSNFLIKTLCGINLEGLDVVPSALERPPRFRKPFDRAQHCPRPAEIIFIEVMTSDCRLKASREGSK